MKGYVITAETPDVSQRTELTPWEWQFTEAVGRVTEFWGFKRNHGRVWGALYLLNAPLSAGKVLELLRLSKGGASIILRELEQWGIIHRVRVAGDDCWNYVAEMDMVKMITKVLADRERLLVSRIKTDLEEAGRLAAEAGADPDTLDRMDRAVLVAVKMEDAIHLFLQTAHLDLGGLSHILDGLAEALSAEEPPAP